MELTAPGKLHFPLQDQLDLRLQTTLVYSGHFLQALIHLLIDVAYGKGLCGRVLHLGDALIAGTARAHNLAIATRNVGDFSGLDVATVNPWEGTGIGQPGMNY